MAFLFALVSGDAQRAARQEAIEGVERMVAKQREALEEALRQERLARMREAQALKKADQERLAREEAERRANEEQQTREEAERIQDKERRATEEARKKDEEERQAREEAEKKQAEECQAKERAQRKEEAAMRREEEERQAREGAERREEKERQSRESGIEPEFIPTSDDIAEARSRLRYREGGRNIAVCGNAGSGKSSFINAIRGLRNNDPGATPTGATETTLKPTSHPCTHSNSLYNWYDIPGAGTQMVSDWQYFRNQTLYAFDHLIVSYDIRFTELDAKILKNFQQCGPSSPELGSPPRTFIVRSKADQNILNIALDMGYDPDDNNRFRMARIRDEAEQKYVYETAMNANSNLERYGLPNQRVYIVSKDNIIKLLQGRRAPHEIDEGKLLRALGVLPPIARR